ncbi:MAG: glutathione S-transferase family protein [Streptosporangiales bacterium]
MILYSEATSPYSAVVRVAVYAKQLAIEIAAPPGGLKSDEYRALSGTGTVPCLRLDDGSALPESTVILAYLDEKFPERPLLPAGAEARARARLLVRLAVDGVIAPIVGLFHDLSDGVPTAQATALERLTAGLGRLEHFLSPEGFAAGPEFSQADCVLGPSLMGVAAFAGMLGAPDLLTRHPKLTAYNGRVSQHPAVAKVLGELQAAMSANPLPG